jgi:hypothetical protein
MSVCANCDRSNLVAALDQISWRQDIRLLQNVKEIDHNNGPTVVFELKWYLGNKPIGSGKILVKIAQGDSNTVRSLGHSKVKMITKWEAMAWALDLEIDVSASQTELFDGSLGVWHLDVIIG